MDKKILLLIILEVLALPLIGSAQLHSYGYQTFSIWSLVDSIVSVIWILFEALVIICFVMAAVLFLTAQGAPEKLNTAKSAFIWGIVGVIVGIIAYSIITIVGSVIGTGGSSVSGNCGGGGFGIFGTFGNEGTSIGGCYSGNGIEINGQYNGSW